MSKHPSGRNETPIGDLIGEWWVINLDRRDDRKALFSIRNCRWGDFHFWQATDAGDPGWSKPGWAVERTRSHHAALSPAEMAAADSHKRLWDYGIREDLDYLMIFEDDAIITMDPGHFGIPEDADLVLIEDSVHRDEHGEVTGWSFGAFGYVVTRKGMRNLAVCTALLDMPIDMVFLAYAESQIRNDFLWSVDRPLQESAPTLRVYVGPKVATHDYGFTSDLGHAGG